MSTRDIQAHLRELYGVEISPELVSAVTDAVLDEVSAWQSRPLEAVYAIVFFDALRVKIRDEGVVKNKAVYLAIGMRCSGHKEIWALDRADRGGQVLAAGDERDSQPRHQRHPDRRGRRSQGLPGGDQRGVPRTVVQTCIVHLIRYSMQFASWKERKAIAAALKPDLQAPIVPTGQQRLDWRIRRRPLGAQIPGHRAELAAQLGTGDSVLRLPRGGAQDHLHHQRDREPAQPGPQGGARTEATSPATRRPAS